MTQDKLKRLYFKTDKEMIMQIMHHLNPKYLLARYRSCKINQSWEISDNDRYNKELNRILNIIKHKIKKYL